MYWVVGWAASPNKVTRPYDHWPIGSRSAVAQRRHGLGHVFGGQDGVGDGDAMVQTHPGHAGARFVGHQLKVIGFAAHDATQGDQGVKRLALGQGLQGDGHL